MRCIIEVEVDGLFDLDELAIEGSDIKRVWTVFDELEMWEGTKFNPHTGEKLTNKTLDDLVLQHRVGVFLEDRIHDWKIVKGNHFHYYTRVASKGETMKVLLEVNEDE